MVEHSPPTTVQVRDNELKRWRKRHGLTVAECADRFAKLIGKPVPVQTWYSWERLFHDEGRKEPSTQAKRGLFLFTGGAVRPDHFSPIEQWRAELTPREAAA